MKKLLPKEKMSISLDQSLKFYAVGFYSMSSWELYKDIENKL